MGVGLTRTKIEFPIELSLYVKVDLLKNEAKPQCLLPPPSPFSVFCFTNIYHFLQQSNIKWFSQLQSTLKNKCSISNSVNSSLAGLFHKCVIKLYLEVQNEKVNVCILFPKKKSQFIDHYLSFFLAAKQHFKNLLKRLQHFYTGNYYYFWAFNIFLQFSHTQKWIIFSLQSCKRFVMIWIIWEVLEKQTLLFKTAVCNKKLLF